MIITALCPLVLSWFLVGRYIGILRIPFFEVLNNTTVKLKTSGVRNRSMTENKIGD